MGVSGNQLERPALNQLLNDVAARPGGHVITGDSSRWGRSQAVCDAVIRRITATGATIIDDEANAGRTA
jgi:DNA invertase Pin-like site-specific DNA recombinase